MNPTYNDMPEADRRNIAILCQDRLADALDAQSMSKQAHWNVKGTQFQALHTLFDDVYAEFVKYVDLIAERAVMLGAQIEGTVRSVAKRSSLVEYPLDIRSGADHVEAMSRMLAQFGKNVRAAITQSEQYHDADTADMFTEISRGVDQYLWMVESHRQEFDHSEKNHKKNIQAVP